MNGCRAIAIKGHSGKIISSDAIDFYRDYWIKGTEILPQNHEFRRAVLQQFFPEGISNKKIVELGVGGEGGFLYLLRDTNETFGFDASQSAIALCRQYNLNVRQQNLDVDKLPLADNAIDILFASEVFEHFSSPQFVLEEIKRVLAPHGAALISTPNPRIFHWPRIFYPELFQKNAFQDFLMINGFQIDSMAGGKTIPLKLPKSEDTAWHWFWYCRKLDMADPHLLFAFGSHFWKQADAHGFRKKPIEAIEYFRLCHQAAPDAYGPRFYLARALVYRLVNGEIEEFNQHINFLIHAAEHGNDEQRMTALYHFAMIYIESAMLGKPVILKPTFDHAIEKLSHCKGSEKWIVKINRALKGLHEANGPSSAAPLVRKNPVHGKDANEDLECTQQTVHLGLVKGEHFGWGICSRYLKKELSNRVAVKDLNSGTQTPTGQKLEGKVVQALTNAEFFPMFDGIRGEENFAYTFFEKELNAVSVQNARKYDLVMGGSSWCRERMLERKIDNCAVLLQGVDPKLFYPIKTRKSTERFVIFSGGKFELRKGQDLVLKAFKILQEKYKDLWLVNCWRNLWPGSARMMESSPYIDFKHREKASWQEMMSRTYARNGLNADRIVTCDLMPHEQQRQLFAQTDMALFPNRCEGGTNLVLMEYMACGKPVIASNTSGHKDILTPQNALCLNDLKNIDIVDDDGKCVARWQEPSLDELIAQIEFAYGHREEMAKIGVQAGEDMQKFTWKQTAQRLLELIKC